MGIDIQIMVSFLPLDFHHSDSYDMQVASRIRKEIMIHLRQI